MVTATEKLITIQKAHRSLLTVGLDSNSMKLPATAHRSQYQFNKAIIDATSPYVFGFKINTAFYESQGARGITELVQTIEYIRSLEKQYYIIIDAKRGDIGSTNEQYVEFITNILHADAVTLHPYLGKEAYGAFLEHSKLLNIFLCKSSNPGSSEFQNLIVSEKPLYAYIAGEIASRWNTSKNCGLVVGTTYPEEYERVLQIAPGLPILLPGLGTQGGSLEDIAVNKSLQYGMIFSISREIIFASTKEDFSVAASAKAKEYNESIRKYL